MGFIAQAVEEASFLVSPIVPWTEPVDLQKTNVASVCVPGVSNGPGKTNTSHIPSSCARLPISTDRFL